MLKRVKGLLVVMLLALSVHTAFAEGVSGKDAAHVARQLWQLKAPAQLADMADLLELRHAWVADGDTMIFVFALPAEGFVLVAGEDNALPVLGFSFESDYDTESLNPVFMGWMNFFIEELRFAAGTQFNQEFSAKEEWKKLLSGGNPYESKTADIAPLLISNWDQGVYYNALCPADPDGPGGKVYAGCVATMMSKIMHYFKYPASGAGQKTYYTNYGPLSVNFSQSQYNYNLMPLKLSTHNYQVAKLMYDCGVAVSMNYTPNGSGAYMNNARDAMVQNFGFSQQTALLSRNSYSALQWNDLVIDNLEQGIPIGYAGYPSGGAGHAFVLDGYKQGDFFHFNWGWSGSYNGYFLLSSLTPGSYTFSNWQSAIMHAVPANNYPAFCSGSRVVDGLSGVIFHGSPNANYADNSLCSWLLTPNDQVSGLTIVFHRFDIEPSDYLIVYNGPDTTSSVLAILTGDTLPANLTTSSNQVLIRFISNDSINARGFELSYNWALSIFCSGLVTLTDPAGTFSDGSGTHNYRDGQMCKWLIEPPLATTITLNFSAFDTEAGADLVRIYNPATVPSQLLATYSGNTLPPAVTSPSGKMLIVFQTNQSNNALGWTANYIASCTGVESRSGEILAKVYPNPVSDKLMLSEMSFHGQVIKYQLSDASGRLCISGLLASRMENETHSVDVSHLKPGLYFLQLHSGSETMRRTVIISR